MALIGAVGADEHGARACADLAREGIDIGGIEVLADTATGVALIVVDANGENQIAVGGGANAALKAEHVRQQLRARLGSAGCVLVSTEIPAEAVTVAVAEAIRAGVPCVLNPAPMLAYVLDVLAFGPILTPNETEARDLVALLPGGDETAVAASIAAISGASVVVTQGSAGVCVVDNGVETQIPAPSVVAVDTTGAGDTFNGVLVAGLARGEPLLASVRRAVNAASISVTVVGARGGMPTLRQIAEFSTG